MVEQSTGWGAIWRRLRRDWFWPFPIGLEMVLPRFTSQGFLDGAYAVCIWAFSSIVIYEVRLSSIP